MSRFSTFRARCSLPAMAITMALTFGAASLPFAAAQAQDRETGAFYAAELAQEQETSQFAAGGIVWRCEGTTCRAPRGNARPLRICHELQRKTGPVTSFVVDGEPLSATLLERCNG